MATSSIRTEMTNMVSILLGQEEEMMRIGSNEKESRTGPETPLPALCTSYHTATVNAPVARVTQTDDDKNQRQLQICDVVMRKQTRPGGGWISPVADDPGKLQTHPLPNPESTDPLDNTGTYEHDALTLMQNTDRDEAPINVASPRIQHAAAKGERLPPG